MRLINGWMLIEKQRKLKTDGGILLHEDYYEKDHMGNRDCINEEPIGTIMDAGESEFEKGQTIIYKRYSGREKVIDGTHCIYIRDEDVEAIIN